MAQRPPRLFSDGASRVLKGVCVTSGGGPGYTRASSEGPLDDRNRPVLVGASQLTQRDAEPAEALEPLEMLERTAREAAEDSGAGERALREIDTVGIVEVVAWRPQNGPRLLAERLGASPRREIVTATGGEIPITLVNDIARRIAAGEVRVALVGGANNVRTLRRAQRARVKLDWTVGGNGQPTRLGVNRRGSSKAEAGYGLNLPPDIYPIFENALRARRGLSLETHRRRVGALLSRFSEVAARNPDAWFPTARSADEITTPSPKNRMIAFPYTKYMNAVLETDQAASLLLMSADAARSLGIPEGRQVHWWGGVHAEEEAWYPSERPEFAVCPSLRKTVTGALEEAGVALDEIDLIDFYSCFPVAVEMACEMLGLDEDDPRGFTVTGGLPYAGGPGNNYTLNSMATMLERLRAQPGAKGLVTGNGWYLTKHSACVLSSAPREADGWPRPQTNGAGDVVYTTASTEPSEGRAALEAYTVIFDRDGAPARGVVVGSTDEGRRFVANTPDYRALLEAFVAAEEIGRKGRVAFREGRNVFDPA